MLLDEDINIKKVNFLKTLYKFNKISITTLIGYGCRLELDKIPAKVI